MQLHDNTTFLFYSHNQVVQSMNWPTLEPKLNAKKQYLPLMLHSTPAGFPSPADDFIDGEIDLNEFLIRNPAATFHVRVAGWSMRDAGIHSGDYVTIDRSLTPVHGDIVIAILDGEFTLKRLEMVGKQWQLIPDNPHFKPIPVRETTEVIGVVIASFRKINRHHDASHSPR